MSERVEWRDIQHWRARAVAAESRVSALEEALRRLVVASEARANLRYSALTHSDWGVRAGAAEITNEFVDALAQAREALVVVGRSQEQEQGLGDEQSSSCEATHRSAEVLYDAVHQMGDEGLKDGAMFSFPESAWWPVVHALEDFVWPEDDPPPVPHSPTTADSVGVQEDRSAVGRLPGEPPAPPEEHRQCAHCGAGWGQACKALGKCDYRAAGVPPVPQEPGQAHGLGGADAPSEGSG